MEHLAPGAVHAALSGDLSDTGLSRILAALRADPAWHVPEPLERGAERVIQAVYRPTGRPYGFPATRSGSDTWRFGRKRSWLGL